MKNPNRRTLKDKGLPSCRSRVVSSYEPGSAVSVYFPVMIFNPCGLGEDLGGEGGGDRSKTVVGMQNE